MERRKFSREFKIEAVKLVRERGVKVAQAARDLDVHATVLRSWVREFAGDPREAFPGNDQMKPEQLEIERLAEAFVRTLKRDYARVSHKPDARAVIDQLPGWFNHYNEAHPHRALGYRSPREFIARSTQEGLSADLGGYFTLR